MAILHNLSDPSNNLTGFDPVGGIAEGTTIGNNYVVRKIVDNLLATNPNFKEITNADPTPVFLQAHPSTIPAVPLVGRNVSNEYINLYRTDDAGLSQATPSCFIYQFIMTNTSYKISMIFRAYHKTSGGSISVVYSPDIFGINSGSGDCIYYNPLSLVSSYHKVAIWSSANALYLASINRSTGDLAGGILIHFPNYTGYNRLTGAITYGLDRNLLSWQNHNAGGTACLEMVSNLYNYNNNDIPTKISYICSIGLLPSNTFTLSGVQRFVTGKLRLAINEGDFKLVSEEFEGVSLIHSSLVGGPASIISANGGYYMVGPIIKDGRQSTMRALFALQ